MKLTNKLNLPQPLVDAIKNDNYTKGAKADISVTQLIDSMQVTFLKRKYRDELEEDVSDRIWALNGQAVHTVLERADTTALKEKRLYTEVNGIVIAGQFDRLVVMDELLQDYKYCSVWEKIYGIKQNRIDQMNIYAFLLEVNGFNVSKAELVMIFRDWQKTKAKLDPSYPQYQVGIVPVELWNKHNTLTYIKDRVALYKLAQSGNIPECTNEERWYSGDKYACMKKGNKRAKRVLDTRENAEQYCNNHKDDLEVVHRPGVNRRCDDYCIVSKFCSQYKEITK